MGLGFGAPCRVSSLLAVSRLVFFGGFRALSLMVWSAREVDDIAQGARTFLSSHVSQYIISLPLHPVQKGLEDLLQS